MGETGNLVALWWLFGIIAGFALIVSIVSVRLNLIQLSLFADTL
jgi:hypothetical protein